MASRDVSYGTDFIVRIRLCFAQNVIKTSWSDSYTKPFISEAVVCLAVQCWMDTKYGVNNENIVHHMRHCIFLSNEENCYLLIIQQLRFVKSKKAQRVCRVIVSKINVHSHTYSYVLVANWYHVREWSTLLAFMFRALACPLVACVKMATRSIVRCRQ